MSQLRLTSKGIVNLDFAGTRLTSSGVVKGAETLVVKRAIRSAAGWATMSQAEKDVYNNIYYETLTAWEATIPDDLVSVNEQWIAECYNDWPTGLVDDVEITAHTSDATRNVIVTTPIEERHSGAPESGFFMKKAKAYDAIIRSNNDYCHIVGIEAQNTSTGGDGFYSNIGTARTYDNCIAKAIDSGFIASSGSTVSNCIAYSSDKGFVSRTYHTSIFYNCTSFNCDTGFLYNTGTTVTLKNCVAYNSTTLDFDISGGTFSYNASSDTTATTLDPTNSIDGITSDDFTDSASNNYNLSPTSRLHGTGTDIGLSSDIIGKAYRTYNSTDYIPIGAFNGLQEFKAIRTSTGWSGMTDHEKARYNNIYYETLTAWEAVVPADLVAVNEQWIAECYDDWPSSLIDNVTIADRTTDLLRNIVIQTPLTERHTGIQGSGFWMSDNSIMINCTAYYCEIIGLDVKVTPSADHGRVSILNAYNVNSCISSGDGVYLTNGIMGDANGYPSGGTYSNNISFDHGGSSSVGINVDYKGVNIYNNTVYNCYQGIRSEGHTGTDTLAKNNVAINNTIDYFGGLWNAGCDYNASGDGTSVSEGIGSITGIASEDFVDSANDNYNLTPTSKLHGVGTDIGLTTDILEKSYGLSGTTYYVPIGAFRGLSEFRAIRSATGWSELTDLEKARYNDTYYELISTWEATIPADLVAINSQYVAECFNDWSLGLDDKFDISIVTTDSTRNVVLTTASGSGTNGTNRHSGTSASGFRTRLTAWNAVNSAINCPYTILYGLELSSDSTAAQSTLIVATSLNMYVTVKNCIFKHNGTGRDHGIHTGNPSCQMYNNIAINCDSGFVSGWNRGDGLSYNNTAVDCAIGFRGYSSTVHLVVKNCVTYNCTIDYQDLNASSSNNASDLGGSAHSSCTITDLTSDDFTDSVNDDYNLSSTSVLHGSGTDVSITEDIISKTYGLSGTTYYVPIGAFRGLSEFRAIRSSTGWGTMSDHEKARYDNVYYELLATWEAAIPSNLVTNNIQAVGECYDDFGSGLAGSITVSGQTTSTSNNIILKPFEGEGHNGVYNSGFKTRNTGNTSFIGKVEANIDFTFDGLTFTNSAEGYSWSTILELASGGMVNNCFFINTYVDTLFRAIYTKSTNNYVRNSVMKDFTYGVHGLTSNLCNVRNCITIDCNTAYNYVNVKNSVAYNSINDIQNSGTSSDNASSKSSSHASVTVLDLTGDDFIDLANDNYNLSKDSRLLGVGTYVSIINDIRGKTIPTAGTEQYTPIGAFYGPEFRAIRSSTGWATLSALEKARYNDTYYELLSTWEAVIPANLITVNEQWVAECYNDWSSLADSTVILGQTTSSTQSIIIRSADGEGHNGIVGDGFTLTHTGDHWGYPIRMYTENVLVENFSVHITNINTGIRFSSDNCIAESIIVTNSKAYSEGYGFSSLADGCIARNCLAIDAPDNGFSTVSWTTSKVHNCTAIGCDTGFGSVHPNASGDTEYINNVAFNSITIGFNQIIVTDANHHHNASSDLTAIGPNSITGISSDDFTDADNDNYNLSPTSRLHGAGTDIGYVSDILDKTYGLSGSTYYVPIGAFRGLSEFRAIRSSTGWATLSALEKARYNDAYYDTLTAWVAIIPSDLVTVNEQHVAECYDDWPSGLASNLDILNKTTDATRNIVFQTADGEGHSGDETGFLMTGYIRIGNIDCQVKGIRLTGDTGFGGAKISLTDHSQSNTIQFDKMHIHDSTQNGFESWASFEGYEVMNSLMRNLSYAARSSSRTNTVYFYNCTAVDCGDYGFIRAVFINCVSVGHTTGDFFDSSTSSHHNASGDTTAPGTNAVTGISLADGVDFTEPSTDDYSLASGSALKDEGTDLSSIFTDDITGTERS